MTLRSAERSRVTGSGERERVIDRTQEGERREREGEGGRGREGRRASPRRRASRRAAGALPAARHMRRCWREDRLRRVRTGEGQPCGKSLLTHLHLCKWIRGRRGGMGRVRRRTTTWARPTPRLLLRWPPRRCKLTTARRRVSTLGHRRVQFAVSKRRCHGRGGRPRTAEGRRAARSRRCHLRPLRERRRRLE